uniref:Uncharacterized protein n=1 Tax=Arundo donax TaxID=35708 RepID=A0A0A8Z519_ARUDO
MYCKRDDADGHDPPGPAPALTAVC